MDGRVRVPGGGGPKVSAPYPSCIVGKNINWDGRFVDKSVQEVLKQTPKM